MIEKFLNALARFGGPGRWVVAGLVCDPVMQRDERLARHVVYLLVVIDVDLEVPQANAVLEQVPSLEKLGVHPGQHEIPCDPCRCAACIASHMAGVHSRA